MFIASLLWVPIKQYQATVLVCKCTRDLKLLLWWNDTTVGSHIKWLA